MKRLVHAKEVVPALLNQWGINETNFTVFSIWEQSIGAMASYASAVGIRNGRLMVEVTSSVCFQELTLRKKELKRILNGHFGKTVVHDIKFRLKGS